MSRTKEELLEASNQVKNETQQGANTANRIGGILYDISEHIGEGGGGGGDTVTITPTQLTGTKIADYSINGQEGSLYAPTSGGGDTLNLPLSSINTLNANPSSSNQILVWNGENWVYQTKPSGGSGGVQNLSDLGDVNIPSPQDGQILKYSTSSSKWEASNESGGGGAQSLSDLNDVSSSSPVDGQILIYDSSISKWKATFGKIDLNLYGTMVNSSATDASIQSTMLNECFSVATYEGGNFQSTFNVYVDYSNNYHYAIRISLILDNPDYRKFKVCGNLTIKDATNFSFPKDINALDTAGYHEYLVTVSKRPFAITNIEDLLPTYNYNSSTNTLDIE